MARRGKSQLLLNNTPPKVLTSNFLSVIAHGVQQNGEAEDRVGNFLHRLEKRDGVNQSVLGVFE
jgi:hypothetical protein